MPLTSDRRADWAVALAGLAVALGLLSADGWRWHLGGVADVASTQGVWALGAWLCGVLLSRTWRQGAVLGGAFPAVGLATYYVYEWLAYDAHAATSQLAGSGAWWFTVSVLGGAVLGAIGSVVHTGVPHRPAIEALAYVLVAGGLVGEGLAAVVLRSTFARSTTFVAVVLLLLGAAVALASNRRVGTGPTLRAAAVVAVLLPLLGVAFVVLERHFGYLTI